jgi:hypothetical protein
MLDAQLFSRRQSSFDDVAPQLQVCTFDQGAWLCIGLRERSTEFL